MKAINTCMYRNWSDLDPYNSSLVQFRKSYGSIHGYLSVVICVFGIVLNAANIIVLTRKNMVTSINVLLTWLAVADNLKMLDYLVFASEFYILKKPNIDWMNSDNVHSAEYLLFHASFALICHNIAVWITVSLAIFRFLYIWFPVKGKELCTVPRAKITVALIYVSIAIICIPNYYTNFLQKKTPAASKDGHDCPTLYTVNMIDHKELAFQMNTYIQAVFAKLVPCVLLTVLTFLLIYAMHKAYRKRKLLISQGKDQDARRHHEHNRTTGMLLAVVMLFLFVELPFGILTLMVIFFSETWMSEVYDNLGDFHELLALCNNAINFVLYCTMSKQFRQTFISIFCKCIPKQNYRIMSMKERSHLNHTHVTTHVDCDNNHQVNNTHVDCENNYPLNTQTHGECENNRPLNTHL